MIAFFDTETSGLPKKKGILADQPHVMQMAVSLYDNERRPVFELSTLVSIPGGVQVELAAFETHRITSGLTQMYGVSKFQAVRLLHFAFDHAELVVAHNLQFDEKLMGFEAERVDVKTLFQGRKTFCTMEATTDLLQLPATEKMLKYGYGPYKNPKLEESYKFFFNESFDNAHDALVDTRACARVFFELKDRHPDRIAQFTKG